MTFLFCHRYIDHLARTTSVGSHQWNVVGGGGGALYWDVDATHRPQGLKRHPNALKLCWLLGLVHTLPLLLGLLLPDSLRHVVDGLATELLWDL